MGFKKARKQVIESLKSGYVLHEQRNNIDVKNLLATGFISTTEVAEIIGRSKGDNYSCSPHHLSADIDVHLIKTTHSGQRWYIKWYFVEPDSIFISMHQ